MLKFKHLKWLILAVIVLFYNAFRQNNVYFHLLFIVHNNKIITCKSSTLSLSNSNVDGLSKHHCLIGVLDPPLTSDWMKGIYSAQGDR